MNVLDHIEDKMNFERLRTHVPRHDRIDCNAAHTLQDLTEFSRQLIL